VNATRDWTHGYPDAETVLAAEDLDLKLRGASREEIAAAVDRFMCSFERRAEPLADRIEAIRRREEVRA
jgi:hypothetical protein